MQTFYVPAVEFEDSYLYSNYNELVMGFLPNSTKNLFHAPLYKSREACQDWCNLANENGFTWEVLDVEVDVEVYEAYMNSYFKMLEELKAMREKVYTTSNTFKQHKMYKPSKKGLKLKKGKEKLKTPPGSC